MKIRVHRPDRIALGTAVGALGFTVLFPPIGAALSLVALIVAAASFWNKESSKGLIILAMIFALLPVLAISLIAPVTFS